MTEFNESGLVFQFNACWVINKYDEHRYFRLLSSAGLKGVDFLGIYKKEELVLIEVKNYRIRFKKKPPLSIYRILNNPELVASKIKSKSEDTLKAIRVIYKYYQRKYFFRLIFPLLKLLRNNSHTVNTWLFWSRAYQLMNEGKIKIVFWMETEAFYPEFSKAEVAAFRERLTMLLNDGSLLCRVEIYSVNGCDVGEALDGVEVLGQWR